MTEHFLSRTETFAAPDTLTHFNPKSPNPTAYKVEFHIKVHLTV